MSQEFAVLPIDKILSVGVDKKGTEILIRVAQTGLPPILMTIPTQVLASGMPHIQQAVAEAKAQQGGGGRKFISMAHDASAAWDEGADKCQLTFQLDGASEFAVGVPKIAAQSLLDVLKLFVGGAADPKVRH